MCSTSLLEVGRSTCTRRPLLGIVDCRAGSGGPHGLASGSLAQDEPDADGSEAKLREPITYEVGAPLPVVEAAPERLRPHLDDDLEIADVELTSLAKADLDVTGLRRTGARLLGTVHCFSHKIRQDFSQAAQHGLADVFVVAHFDDRHAQLSIGGTRSSSVGRHSIVPEASRGPHGEDPAGYLRNPDRTARVHVERRGIEFKLCDPFSDPAGLQSVQMKSQLAR